MVAGRKTPFARSLMPSSHSFAILSQPTHPPNLVVIQGRERSLGLKTILNFFNQVGVWDMQCEPTTAGLTSIIVI